MADANLFVPERRDTHLKRVAFGVAVVLHAAVLFIRFPAQKPAGVGRPLKQTVSVRRYVPPPPPLARREISMRKTERKLPIPDPTPDEPEPVYEPEIPIAPVFTTPDIELLIGTPEPPTDTSTLIAGVGDVTEPVRLPESYVRPEYPEEARVARVEGNVILEIVILADGTVGDVHVVSSDTPDAGFEASAIAAVRQWRYEPARYRSKPVNVYYTVMVEFDLM